MGPPLAPIAAAPPRDGTVERSPRPRTYFVLASTTIATCVSSRRRRAALALYAATLISARVGTPTLLWTAANLAFALPAALKAGTLPTVCNAFSTATCPLA